MVIMTNATTGERLSKKGDKLEVTKILVLAAVSFFLGFVLVVLFFKPDSPSVDHSTAPPALPAPPAPPEPSSPKVDTGPSAAVAPAPATAQGEGYAPTRYAAADSKGEGYAPAPSEMAPAAPAVDEPQPAANHPEVAPGRTPDGVTIDGDAFYLKCWDRSGTELPGTSCDRLKILEKRFSTRLYVVHKCKEQSAGAKAEGKLNLGMEVDFVAMSIRFWNGASSDLPEGGKVATCLRDELAGLPLSSINHEYDKYRIFFTVLFGTGAGEAPRTKEVAAKKDGKLLKVVKDRVRVRKTPLDGDVIGTISTGNQVERLEKKGDWCRVLTPNGNEGWMICDALSK